MLSRRSALAASLAVPFLPKAPTVALGADMAAPCRANLARLFPRALAAARELGGICSDGESGSALIARLGETPGERLRLATAKPSELRAIIEARIRADFALGRTRRIDGWVLSRTETLVFALLAT